jgi:hypothetical protein
VCIMCYTRTKHVINKLDLFTIGRFNNTVTVLE